MSGRLNGKNSIITGAGSGIGRASALLFAREGANLVLADVNEANLSMVEDEIAKMGGTVVARKTDVSSEDEIKALINLGLEKFMNIDILVNNAGISGGLDALEDQRSEEWHQIFDINVMGPVYATKHIIAHMKARRHGSIINIASVAGILSGAGGNACPRMGKVLQRPLRFTQAADRKLPAGYFLCAQDIAQSSGCYRRIQSCGTVAVSGRRRDPRWSWP